MSTFLTFLARVFYNIQKWTNRLTAVRCDGGEGQPQTVTTETKNPIDFDDETEFDEETCPKCGHYPSLARRCSVLGCDDGWINRYDEDPLWYDEDDEEMCTECWGTGWQRWCPKCGFDLQRPRPARAETEEL